MAKKTIDEIKAKKQEALRRFNREIQIIKTRENQKNRTVNARKNYLIGNYFYSLLPDPDKLPEVFEFSWDLFHKSLTRDADRALFGLPPLKEPAPADKAPETRTLMEVPTHQKVDAQAIVAKAKKTKPSTISAAKRRQARDLIGNGLSLRQAALKLNVCRSTLSDVLSRGK